MAMLDFVELSDDDDEPAVKQGHDAHLPCHDLTMEEDVAEEDSNAHSVLFFEAGHGVVEEAMQQQPVNQVFVAAVDCAKQAMQHSGNQDLAVDSAEYAMQSVSAAGDFPSQVVAASNCSKEAMQSKHADTAAAAAVAAACSPMTEEDATSSFSMAEQGATPSSSRTQHQNHKTDALLNSCPVSTAAAFPQKFWKAGEFKAASQTSISTPSSSGENIMFPRSGEQLQFSRPSSEPCSAQMHVSPVNHKGMKRGSTSLMENAGDRIAKKARVDGPSSGKAKQTGGVAAVDLSVLICTFCCRPLKPPVFQCKGRHLGCGRCVAELPGEQCQTCDHGGSFSSCPIMDDLVSLAMVECAHAGCKKSVPYHELHDHESTCPHAPCYCTESGCSFAGQPLALLGHLEDLHSVPVHKIHYDKVHRLQMPQPRCLVHAVEDNSAFLLATGALGVATVLSAVCIRAGASPPQYAVKLWVNGPPPPSSAAGSILLDMKAVTSSPRPGEVAVEELPSFLTVPPAYLVGSGASKEVTLDIRIDKM